VDTEHDERQAYQTVALLSALSVAAEWHETKSLADTPSDPTTLLPHAAAHEAATNDAELLGALAYRVRLLALTDSDEESDSVGLLRRMDRALLLRRMGRVSIRLHQHLLSLYPIVDADVIEDVRTLERSRKMLTDPVDEPFESRLMSYTDAVLSTVETTQSQLKAI
jgi:hypothetical protein